MEGGREGNRTHTGTHTHTERHTAEKGMKKVKHETPFTFLLLHRSTAAQTTLVSIPLDQSKVRHDQLGPFTKNVNDL